MAESKTPKQFKIETHRTYASLTGSIAAGTLLYSDRIYFSEAFVGIPHISLSLGTDSQSPDAQKIGLSWSDLTNQGVTVRARALQNITGEKITIDLIAMM